MNKFKVGDHVYDVQNPEDKAVVTAVNEEEISVLWDGYEVEGHWPADSFEKVADPLPSILSIDVDIKSLGDIHISIPTLHAYLEKVGWEKKGAVAWRGDEEAIWCVWHSKTAKFSNGEAIDLFVPEIEIEHPSHSSNVAAIINRISAISDRPKLEVLNEMLVLQYDI